MNTQQRWDYIQNNERYIREYMAQHDAEVRAKQQQSKFKGLLQWLKK
jgi:hypothetical protein